MDWLNVYGIVFMAGIMVPNIIFAAAHKEGFENRYANKTLEILEQVGRYGSFCFMIIQIPGTCLGFWFDGAKMLYLVGNAMLCLLYGLFWRIYWKRNCAAKALLLSILPSLVFLFSGVVLGNIPLLITTLLFAPAHITISYKNAG